jgi:hypothetical protein
MRGVVTFVAAMLVAAAAVSSTAGAVTPEDSGVHRAGEATPAANAGRCWRWGWHGWGWYAACAKPADPCLKCQWHWGKRNCWRTC